MQQEQQQHKASARHQVAPTSVQRPPARHSMSTAQHTPAAAQASPVPQQAKHPQAAGEIAAYRRMLQGLLDTIGSMSNIMYAKTVCHHHDEAICFLEKAIVSKHPCCNKKSNSSVSRSDLPCMWKLLQYAAITSSWRLLWYHACYTLTFFAGALPVAFCSIV